MSLEANLAAWFKANGWTWHLLNNRTVVPDETDIEEALDAAAKRLYTSPVGTQLEVGRLIIQKTHKGHDVYIYYGSYE